MSYQEYLEKVESYRAAMQAFIDSEDPNKDADVFQKTCDVGFLFGNVPDETVLDFMDRMRTAESADEQGIIDDFKAKDSGYQELFFKLMDIVMLMSLINEDTDQLSTQKNWVEKLKNNI